MTSVPLVEVTRRDVSTGAELVESLHHGHVVVVADGEPIWSLGDAARTTFIRSAAKPVQAAACLEVLGDGASVLSAAEIAVAWSSHTSEPAQLLAISRLLERAGIGETELTCPPADPPDGGAQTRLHHNCAGKHALFALAGRELGVPRHDLLSPQAALQRHVLSTLGAWFGPTVGVGVDGCGAPAVAVPLTGLAAGFARLVDAGDDAGTVREAGLREPYLVGGHARIDSALLAAGVVAKVGAEGVYGAGWRTSQGSRGVAVKVEDGAERAASCALHSLLLAFGAVDETVWTTPPALGGDRPAGVVRPTPQLRTALEAAAS